MTEVRMSLGINVSILVILTIFAVLLSLPLRLLFNTNYYSASDSEIASPQSSETDGRVGMNGTVAILPKPVDYRKLKRCQRFPYEARMKSIFVSDYDRNCTYARVVARTRKVERGRTASEGKPEARAARPEKRRKSGKEETTERKESRRAKGDDKEDDKKVAKVAEVEAEAANPVNLTEPGDVVTDGGQDATEDKEEPVSVSSHILVAMLVVSGLFAFVEVLRIRLSKDKHKDTSRGSTIGPGRSSAVDLPPVVSRFAPKAPMTSQRSFEMQGMHRSTLRLLGTSSPRDNRMLIRNSTMTGYASRGLTGPAQRTTISSMFFLLIICACN